MALKLLVERAAGTGSHLCEFIRSLPQQPVDLPALWRPEDVRQLQYPALEPRLLQVRRCDATGFVTRDM